MAESLSDISFNRHQLQAAGAISSLALEKIDTDYGTGYPNYAVATDHLCYNNGHHGRKVQEDSERVGEALGMGRSELIVARTAGVAHDVVQRRGRGVDEAASADWLEEQMRAHGPFPEVAIITGRVAILGTQPHLLPDLTLVGQHVNDFDFASRSEEAVAKAVAAADTGEIFTPLGPYLGHRLYQQLQRKQPHEAPDLDGLLAFQLRQARMITDYKYPLAIAERVLATHKSAVIAYNERLVAQLQAGDIESWQQLLEQDLEFMRQQS